MRALLTASALVLASATLAAAAPVPEFIKGSAGEWLVVTDDGAPGCRIVLKAEPVAKGWRASPAADCAARLPAVARATAWTYESGVKLLGADGAILLDFAEDETTLMKTSFERKPVRFLVKAPARVERAPHAPSLAGTWTLRRPGGPPLCTLTLTRGPKDEATELTARPGTPCDPALARLKLTSARVEDYTLMLYGQPETSLKFEPAGPGRYAKAEGGRPLEMVLEP